MSKESFSYDSTVGAGFHARLKFNELLIAFHWTQEYWESLSAEKQKELILERFTDAIEIELDILYQY